MRTTDEQVLRLRAERARGRSVEVAAIHQALVLIARAIALTHSRWRHPGSCVDPLLDLLRAGAWGRAEREPGLLVRPAEPVRLSQRPWDASPKKRGTRHDR